MARTRKAKEDKDLGAYERLAELAGSLADPVRLEIIDALAQGARTVDSLAKVCGLPTKNISHHLQKLRACGLVDRFKLGRRAIYSLADDTVASFWMTYRDFSERLMERRSHAVVEQTGDGVTVDSLARLLAEDRVLVIDVRPEEEFRAGHLPGARSLPIEELERRLPELPRGRPVVAFCRGPYCRLADRAVARLREAGYEALRCADGVVEWRAAGMSVTREAPAGEALEASFPG